MPPKKPDISAGEALRIAKGAAALQQLRYTKHALERMDQRGAQAEDVRTAVQTATSAVWRPSDETWKLTGGTDKDGDELMVGASLSGNAVRVCTVY